MLLLLLLPREESPPRARTPPRIDDVASSHGVTAGSEREVSQPAPHPNQKWFFALGLSQLKNTHMKSCLLEIKTHTLGSRCLVCKHTHKIEFKKFCFGRRRWLLDVSFCSNSSNYYSKLAFSNVTGRKPLLTEPPPAGALSHGIRRPAQSDTAETLCASHQTVGQLIVRTPDGEVTTSAHDLRPFCCCC